MKILIAGDSWGNGEWKWRTKSSYGVSHPGVAGYLKKQGHDVSNISEGGASLNLILKKLTNIKHNYDYVFVFVTDPHRDLLPTDFWIKGYSYNSYVERHHELIKKFVKSLDTLNIGPIKLIGGLSKCYDSYTEGTSVSIAIPSVLELIIPNKKQFEIYCHTYYHLLKNSKIRKKVSREVILKMYTQYESYEDYTKHPIMYPDGHHPNRVGHYKIYKLLKEKYNL